MPAHRKPKPYKTKKFMEIDENLVLNLAKIWCTLKEIATICGCSVDTIENRFRDTVDKGYDLGRETLRRAQWAAAIEGKSVPMMIWLGKQKLGQREPSPEDHDNQVTEVAITVHPSQVTNENRSNV